MNCRRHTQALRPLHKTIRGAMQASRGTGGLLYGSPLSWVMESTGLIQGGRWCQGKELKNLGSGGSEANEGLGVGLEKSSEAWKACLCTRRRPGRAMS